MSGEPVEERERRVGRNEAVFRAVNNEIADLNDTFTVVDNEEFEIVCECGEMSCVEQIPVMSETYARVRTDPTLFFLVPGHEDATVEAVVESHQVHVVVRKPRGTPAEIAANSPPG